MMQIKVVLSLSLLLFSGFVYAADKTSIYDLPVEFKDTSGKKVLLSQFKGKPTVMTMTYSSCPMACPRILQRVKGIQKTAKKDGKEANYVIVTFDPERDTSAHLAKVQKESDGTAGWSFLTGSNASVRQLSMVLGIRFQKNPEDGNISHDNKIVVLDEKGVIVKELNGLNVDPTDSL
jgi:protein SCO1/2